MKKFTITLLFISIITFSFSQKAVAPHDKIEQFLGTTTYVVYDSDIFNSYNNAIKDAVESTWTITPYKFISMDEFNTMRHNPAYSFLVRTKVVPDNNKVNSEYTFLTLVLGEQNKTFEQLTEICSFPLSYYNTDYDKYDYKMGALLRFVQNHINITYNNENLNETNIIGYYNKNMSDVQGKTIYFNADNLNTDVNTLSKIAKFYDGKIKITDEEEIEDAIINKDENVIILHIVMPPDGSNYDGKCYKMLIGAADGKLYYFDKQNITTKKPGKFLKSDFKKL